MVVNKNPIMTRIDDNLFKLLEDFSKEKRWKTSQAIREIVAQFFNYELTDNVGQSIWTSQFYQKQTLKSIGFTKSTKIYN